MSTPNTPEPAPVANDRPHIADLVIADIQERKEQGIAKYGTPLQPFNGRRPLTDAYQEVLDLGQYIRQAIEEGWAPKPARAELFDIGPDGIGFVRLFDSGGQAICALPLKVPGAKRDRDDAIKAAKAIWDDCLDRRGLKWEFRKIENYVRGEIISAWSRLIRGGTE